MRVVSRCGGWVWSLGGALNDDQWFVCLCLRLINVTFLPVFHTFFSYITVNHQPYLAFPKLNFLFYYFFPFLSTKLFLHKYHVITGGEMIIRQASL